MTEIKFVDQSVRDGQQSLWGLRMRAGHMLPMAEDLDRSGYQYLDVTGSAMFEIMTREFKENPWEFLDLMNAAMPNSVLRAGIRPNASNGSGFTMAPFALVDLYAETMIKHGLQSFWIYDCLYNLDQMERLARVVHRVGGKATPSIMYTLSPFHTDEFFAAKVREFVSWGVIDTIYVEDAGGVLTPDRAATLLPALVLAAGDVPVELHCHQTTGLAPLNYIEGVKAGIRTLHTCSRPLANGPSLPSVEQTTRNMRDLGYSTNLDEDRLANMATYFEGIARDGGYPLGVPEEYSVLTYAHQLPGGMLGTLKVQLRQHGLEDRLGEALIETGRVREELGSPVMATPISQLVGIQALLNVTSGDRYSQVPDDVVLYTLGRLGTPPGPIDPEVKDRILGTTRAKELAAIETPQPSIEEIRKQHRSGIGDEELLLRALLQESVVDNMLAAGPLQRDLRRGVSPVAALVRSLSAPGCSDSVQYSDPDVSISLSRQR